MIPLKVTVVQDDCISCGLCISVCSEVFGWNGDDKAEAFDREVPDSSIDNCRLAIEGCPTEAISEV